MARSSAVRPRYSTIDRVFASTLPKVWTTPCGFPVLPDVYRTNAGHSTDSFGIGDRCGRQRGPGRRGRRRGAASSVTPPVASSNAVGERAAMHNPQVVDRASRQRHAPRSSVACPDERLTAPGSSRRCHPGPRRSIGGSPPRRCRRARSGEAGDDGGRGVREREQDAAAGADPPCREVAREGANPAGQLTVGQPRRCAGDRRRAGRPLGMEEEPVWQERRVRKANVRRSPIRPVAGDRYPRHVPRLGGNYRRLRRAPAASTDIASPPTKYSAWSRETCSHLTCFGSTLAR